MNEPLIKVLDVLPKVEFHTPVVTVPNEARLVAEVILFCAAVPTVPYKFVATTSVPCILPTAVTLPNEPVDVALPLIVVDSIVVLLIVVTSNVSAFILPNDPVEVDEPLTSPLEEIAPNKGFEVVVKCCPVL